MEQVNVTELRKHLPHYLRQVKKGMELQITSHGKNIARIVQENDDLELARQRLDALRGTMIVSDIIEPIQEMQWSGDADNL